MAFFFTCFIVLFSPDFSGDTSVVTYSEKKLARVDIEQDYDQLYLYRSPKRDVEQRLYVKALANNRIQFRLIIIKENCDEAFDGEATVDLEQDPEIDEDGEGMAYSALAYLFSQPKFEMSLRIAEDKEKTIIQFEPNEENAVSCVPVSGKLMYAE